MYGCRFGIWAGNPPAASIHFACCAHGRRAQWGCAKPICNTHAAGCVAGPAAGYFGKRLRARAAQCGRGGEACFMGAGPFIRAGEWLTLWRRACASRIAGAAAACGGKPSTRCALGDGGGSGLRRAVCRGGGATRRALSAGFHRDKASGLAGGGLRAADLAHQGCRSGWAECGARKVAGAGPTLTSQPAGSAGAGCCPLGCGTVSRAGSGARSLDGRV